MASQTGPRVKASAARKERQDFDGMWKEIFINILRPSMEFCCKPLYSIIDWSRPVEFLDKELRGSRKRFVDILVKVYLLNGEQAAILLHIEIQARRQDHFDFRIYEYQFLLTKRHGLNVITLAVLTDNDPAWRPGQFGYQVADWGTSVTYPVFKLIDWEPRWAELEQSDNPFALVIMAFLKANATRRKGRERLYWKIELVKMLQARGYGKIESEELLRFIDWMLKLPEKLELEFDEEVQKLEGTMSIPYVTSWERNGIVKGRKEGRQEGHQEGRQEARQEDVIKTLKLRFGRVPSTLTDGVVSIQDTALLEELFSGAVTSGSVEEFEQLVSEQLVKLSSRPALGS